MGFKSTLCIRFATFTNDAAIKSFFLGNIRLGYRLPVDGLGIGLQKAEISLNVTNMFDKMDASTVQASANTNVYPIPPRQGFGTLSVMV